MKLGLSPGFYFYQVKSDRLIRYIQEVRSQKSEVRSQKSELPVYWGIEPARNCRNGDKLNFFIKSIRQLRQ